MKYRVHRSAPRMTRDRHKLEQLPDGPEGEVVSIIQNVTSGPAKTVDFLLIAEKVG